LAEKSGLRQGKIKGFSKFVERPAGTTSPYVGALRHDRERPFFVTV
jgi:hypothetical protein